MIDRTLLPILKALTRPYGAHMPKKVRRAENTSVNSSYSNISHSNYIPGISGTANAMFDSDFFYWYGGNSGNGDYSLCRTCRTVAFGYLERINHQRRVDKAGRQCPKILLEALDLLRQDKKCAICNSKTTYIKYGVYLCSLACEATWKFKPVPENLRAAFQLIGYNEADSL